MKTVLISGAAGFLGSHLCDRFIKEGYRIIAIDNLTTGNIKNIEHLLSLKQFEFYDTDIVKFQCLSGKVDYILHFASPASPVDYLKAPIETLKIGAFGTYNLLELARIEKARILVASSSEIYGDPIVHPQSEEYWGNVNSIGPRGVYDEAKRYLEAITMAYHTFYGVDIRIARIFNTYGTRMRLNDGRVVPSFIGQILRDEPMTIFGDGTQTRSFCFISDLVEGVYKLLFSNYVFPINLGNPEEYSLLDLAQIIMKSLGVKKEIIYKDLPQDDPKRRRPDITKAKAFLNWEPKVSFGEGIKITFDYYLRLNSKKDASFQESIK